MIKLLGTVDFLQFHIFKSTEEGTNNTVFLSGPLHYGFHSHGTKNGGDKNVDNLKLFMIQVDNDGWVVRKC